MANAIDTLVILGASGDLTERLLLPGLAGLLASDRGRPLRLLGAGMEELSPAAWRKRVSLAFTGHDGPLLKQALDTTTYQRADVTEPADLSRLLAAAEGTPALYFALPPAVTARTCDALQRVDHRKDLVLVLEKPFGTDLSSARRLNELLGRLVPETQIHRVDHFLGRSDVLNILGSRFANRFLEPLLSNRHVAGIEIVYDEDLTLEGRAGYYDRAGALMDMIQSHLLQVMGLLMMEPPATLHERDLRDGKTAVLRATHLFGTAKESARRARYTAGRIGRRQVPAYIREPGVDRSNRTETLAELTVEVRNWRWAGVPVTLRSGKALGTPRKEAIVTFKPVPHLPEGFTGTEALDQLVIGFKPARMSLLMDINGPSSALQLEQAKLTADLAPGHLDAYGEVLANVLAGDATLSVRGDAAEECWRIVAPALRAWQRDESPMDTYPAGSDGPKRWRRPLLAL